MSDTTTVPGTYLNGEIAQLQATYDRAKITMELAGRALVILKGTARLVGPQASESSDPEHDPLNPERGAWKATLGLGLNKRQRKAVREYVNGATGGAVAKRYAVSPPLIYKWVRQAGETVRPRGYNMQASK